MINKLSKFIGLFTGFALLLPTIAFAHVVVTPSQVGIGDTQMFSVSVPNEKQSDVTQLKLSIPTGLEELTPMVKPGWQIDTTKSGTGDEATVTAITWSGGTVPIGLGDTFTFRAQAPAKAGQLVWKAYQTYADGTTVAWDQKPAASGDDDGGDAGPYSVTKVANDLTPAVASPKSNDTLSLTIAIVALVLALSATLRSRKA